MFRILFEPGVLGASRGLGGDAVNAAGRLRGAEFSVLKRAGVELGERHALRLVTCGAGTAAVLAGCFLRASA